MRCRRLFAISTSAFPGWLVAMSPAWLLCASLLAPGSALASTFTEPMDGLQEVGPNGSTATRFAKITVVGNLLSVDPGANIGVAIGLPSFVDDFGAGTAASARGVLLAGLEAGRAYVNIHDAVFPGGGIRGHVVPEPSAHALLAVALATTVACHRAATRRLWLHGPVRGAAALAQHESSPIGCAVHSRVITRICCANRNRIR
jgi:hypothetical protein